MKQPVIEYSMLIFNKARTVLFHRLPLNSPAPIFPEGHILTINDDQFIVDSVTTSITYSDDKNLVCYVTEVLISVHL